jgi:predicted ATP-dependent serine protease
VSYLPVDFLYDEKARFIMTCLFNYDKSFNKPVGDIDNFFEALKHSKRFRNMSDVEKEELKMFIRHLYTYNSTVAFDTVVITLRACYANRIFSQEMDKQDDSVAAMRTVSSVIAPIDGMLKSNIVINNHDVAAAEAEHSNVIRLNRAYGLTLIDDKIKFQTKQFHIVSGRSGAGKSILLGMAAQQALKQGLSVLYIAADMSALDIELRLAKAFKDDFLQAPGNITIDEKPGITYIDEIELDVIQSKPDLLIVDNFDNISIREQRGATKISQSEYNSQHLLRIGKQYNCCVVVAAQQNHNNDSGDYDIYGAKNVKFVATSFLAICPRSEEDLLSGVSRIFIVKNRGIGAGATVKVLNNAEKNLTFADLLDDSQEIK